MKAKLFFSLIALALVLSCSKDDDPTPQSKAENDLPEIAAQSFNANENIGDAVVIGVVAATDDDIEDVLEFSIILDSDNLFEISKEGALSLRDNKSLDFLTSTSHKITVEVTDKKYKASAEITINVTNINEAPAFDPETLAFSPKEDITDADVIGTVKATDPDNDSLEFNMVTNTEDNLFEITKEGVLTLASGMNLDYESVQEYTISVGVFDGELETKEDVTITVENVIDTLAEDPEAFVTTWTVQAGGFIEIGTHPDETYDFTIDWGDGSDEEQITEQNPVHEYAQSGTYTVYIKGQFPALFMNNSIYAPNLTSVERWGANVWKSFQRAFYGCSEMIYNAMDTPNLINVTDLSYMFAYAAKFNGDIGNWDISNITNMEYMFLQAAAFDGNIGDWAEKTSNVENMRSMFAYADVFNQDISTWDVSKVQNMFGMFLLTQDFNQDLSEWNTASLTNITGMFRLANSFNQSVGTWNISNIEFMKDMFKDSAISPSNYSATLVGWAANDNADIPDGIELDDPNGMGIQYCMNDLLTVQALSKLTVDNLWTIKTENGINCN